MANKQLTTFPAYSQHFRCMKEIIESAQDYKIFELLFDEWLERKRTGKGLLIKLSNTSISFLTRVSRWRIPVHLKNLSVMKVIKQNKAGIDLNADIIYSLVIAYNNLTDNESKAQFSKAVTNGDYNQLRILGYEELKEQYLSMMLNGSPIIDKNLSVEENQTENDKFLAKNDKNLSNDADINAENDKNLSVLSEEELEVVEFYADIIDKNLSKRREMEEFRNEFLSFFDKNLSVEEATLFVDAIFDKNLSILSKYWVKFGHILVLLTCQIFVSKGDKFLSKGCQIFVTVNKKNKQKNKVSQILKKLSKSEENFEDEFSEEEPDETSSFEEKEEQSEQPVKTSRTNKDNDKDNSGFVNVPPEIIPTWDMKAQEQYLQMRKKKNLPFLPAEKVEEYISDIRNCVDRKDKLFLYYLFQIAHELFDTEEVLDEEGNVLSEASTNIIGHPVYEERISQDLLFPAMESVENIMKAGIVEVDGEKYKITVKDDCNLNNLIDWERQPSSLNQGGWLYIISLDHFRDVYADEVPEVKNVNSREARRAKMDDSREFIHKLILMAQFDDKYELLTDMEKTVYNFVEEFMELDENMKPLDARKRKTVNGGELYLTAMKDEVFRFKITGLVGKVTWDDFAGVFFENKMDEYESLPIRPNMFDAEMIRRYNALHNSQSHIDEFDLNELKEECGLINVG